VQGSSTLSSSQAAFSPISETAALRQTLLRKDRSFHLDHESGHRGIYLRDRRGVCIGCPTMPFGRANFF
jgi:hypothetical protein